MTYHDLLDELRRLGALKNNWYSVATTVGELKRADAGPPQPVRRLKDASDACGYSANTINRISVVREFLDAVKDSIPELQGTDPNTLPFTSLEVVKRLHQVDRTQGIRMLVEVTTGRITIRKLKELYKATVAENTNAASAHQVARFEARDFEEAALKAVRASVDQLFGVKQNLLIERLGASPFSISAVVYKQSTRDKLPPLFGLDFAFIRDQEKTVNLDPLLLRTLVSASFFQRYWVVFAASIGEDCIRDFSLILDELERASIGVAVLPWESGKHASLAGEHLRIFRVPTDNPSPDWRQKIYKIRDLRNRMNRPRTTLRG